MKYDHIYAQPFGLGKIQATSIKYVHLYMAISTSWYREHRQDNKHSTISPQL